MIGIVQAFDQFPDQRALFEADPSLIPNAVQECIRYVTPLAYMRRTATADADLFGNQIKAGSPQYAMYGFAVFYALCLVLNWWFYLRTNAYVKNP